MNFTWKEYKYKLNIQKHGIDFNDVPEMFNYPYLSAIDHRKDYGEERWVAIGIMKGIIVVVVYTEESEETYHLISARKATKNESKKLKEKL